MTPARAATGIAGGALYPYLFLITPRWLAARNRVRRLGAGQRVQLGVFAAVGIGVGAGVYAVFLRVLNYFLAVPDFGPILTRKLLGMIFLTFLSILLFSNVITSLSTFFLSKELDRLVAAPIGMRRLFWTRFAETVFESSWMVPIFALPVFIAYGVAHGAGPGFYGATAAAFIPFLLIPAALGVALTTVLVNIFPARRTKDIMALLTILAGAMLYMLVRVLRPERLVNPEAFADFMDFLSAMRAPSAPYLPSAWAVEVVFPFLGADTGAPGFHFLLLATTAAVACMLSEWVVSRWFLPGWSKAQEGRQARLTQHALWERALGAATLPFAAQTRLLVIKEVKTFFRDTSQWSQLILLFAIVVVYIYNFSVLPLAGGPLVTFYFKNVVAFANLALAAFVTAAVAVRFVFPAISIEGRAFWIVKSAPLRLRRVWWSKFWTALVPLLVLGEVLVVLTNAYLRVMPQMMWLSAITLAAMLFGIVSLGLALGVFYPRFDADNAAKIAAGPGGLVYMMLCVGFIGTVVVLEAWPVYVLFMSRLRAEPISAMEWTGIIASLAGVIALSVSVFAISTRRGLQQLERLEV